MKARKCAIMSEAKKRLGKIRREEAEETGGEEGRARTGEPIKLKDR